MPACLLDKNVVRAAIEGVGKTQIAQPLTHRQRTALELLLAAEQNELTLFISIEVQHILDRYGNHPDVQVFLRFVEILRPTRYFKRWARRLREHGMETWGTIFYRSRVAVETLCRVLKALAEGLDIRAAARVFDVDPNTVPDWLRQAAEHMEALSHHLLHELELSQVQLDELWALLGLREGPVAQLARQTRPSCWVWVALDPVSKLVLAWVVGDRSLETAQGLIHGEAQVLAAGWVPLFLSDQGAPYATAWLTHFGHWVEIPRRCPRGRPPAPPRWMPLPELVYAQVVKRRVKGRVVAVSQRVVYGRRLLIQAVLDRTGVGRMINTAYPQC